MKTLLTTLVLLASLVCFGQKQTKENNAVKVEILSEEHITTEYRPRDMIVTNYGDLEPAPCPQKIAGCLVMHWRKKGSGAPPVSNVFDDVAALTKRVDSLIKVVEVLKANPFAGMTLVPEHKVIPIPR